MKPHPPHLLRLHHLLNEQTGLGMRASELDGFIAGVIVSPTEIPMHEWLPVAWGQTVATDEVNQSWPPAEFIDVVMEHHRLTLRSVLDGGYRPVFDHSPDGTIQWPVCIRGFEKALKLRPLDFATLLDQDDDVRIALLGMTMLIMGLRQPETVNEELDIQAPELIGRSIPRLIGCPEAFISTPTAYGLH